MSLENERKEENAKKAFDEGFSQGPPSIGIVPVLMSHRLQGDIMSRGMIKKHKKVKKLIPKKATVTKKLKSPKLSCQRNVPGPGRYNTYTLVGCRGHDPTKKKAPCFSFGSKGSILNVTRSPGPMYNIGGLSRKGKIRNPNFTFGSKSPVSYKTISPGPAAYGNKILFIGTGQPSALLIGKPKDPKGFKTPGPVEKLSYLGKKKPIAVLIGKHKSLKNSGYPSPNSYKVVDVGVYKTKVPSYTMGYRRLIEPKNTSVPGVGTYSPKYSSPKGKPGFIFGLKHSICEVIPKDTKYI